MKRNDNSTYI